MNGGSRAYPHVEISLDNLAHNLDAVSSKLCADQAIIAVVKDCAYGCGARPTARVLEQLGVAFFAVARAAEARDLRTAGIVSPVLILGDCSDDEAMWAAANDVRLTINDPADIERFSALRTRLRVHVNIDTGMGRLGVQGSEAGAVAAALTAAKALEVEGIYTHFACADIPRTQTVSQQQRRFCEVLRIFGQAGIAPPIIHCSNTAAIARFPFRQATHIRPGISLYGCNPDPAQDFGLNLRPVASLKARVIKIKRVPAGTPISYGGHYITEGETCIATIAVGYGHGLPRLVSGRGDVLIRGKRYRIAGNVTMDFIMVDAGAQPHIMVGDEAVVMGSQGNDCIHPDEIARQCHTIGYEILCNLSRRIDRYYVRNGEVVLHEQGLHY